MTCGIAIFLFSFGCATTPIPTNLSVMELFSQGQKAFEKKKYQEAAETFKKIKIEFPESITLSQVRLKIGESYYLDKKYEEAIAEYKEFLEYHSANKDKDLARYRIGMSFYKQMLPPDLDPTKTKEALKQFDELLKDTPDSSYVKDSLERIKECKDKLARHEYYIGEFYYRTKQYKAAIRRLTGLLENFPAQKIEPMVISLLAESYWKGEERERALKTYNEILLRYPKSSYAKHASFMLDKYGMEYGIEVGLKKEAVKTD